MTPKYSLFNALTPEGRWCNEWARATALKCPAERREGLKIVLNAILPDPVAYADFAGALAKDFLATGLEPLLTAEDLAMVEELRSKLEADEGTTEAALQVQLVLTQVQERRRLAGDDVNQIFQSCDDPRSTRESRARCVRNLVARGEISDRALGIYAKFLLNIPEPDDAAMMQRHLTPLFQVGFEADSAQLARAEHSAKKFAALAQTLPGVASALGLAALRLHENHVSAAHYFAIALRAKRDDPVAKFGQVIASIQAGHHAAAETLVQSFGATADRNIQALGRYAAVANWLDGNGMSTPLPVLAGEIPAEQLRPWLGWRVDFTVARLQLVEGAASSAANSFAMLAAQHPEDPRTAYYAAWSDWLTDNHARIPTWLAKHSNWNGAWTLLCRCWDAAPDSVPDEEVHKILALAAPEFARLADHRWAIYREENPPVILAIRAGGSLEEELEALRIQLGHACRRADMKGLTETMGQPLFRVLPRADREFWAGMNASLVGNSDEALRLFRVAAGEGGHPRAAWALAVIYATTKDMAQAQEWSSRALARRTDARSFAWRTWLGACTDELVIPQQLEQLAAQGSKLACYVRAQLGFIEVDVARRAGNRADAERGLSQILTWLAVVKTSPLKFREDVALLETCARFLADPKRGAPILAAQWPKMEAIRREDQRPWLVWLAVMAKILRRDSRHLPAVSRALDSLLQKVVDMPDAISSALACGISAAAADTPHAEASEQWLKMLRALPQTAGGEGGLETARLAQAARAWQQSSRADPQTAPIIAAALTDELKADRGNLGLALVAAYLHLLSDRPDSALAALRDCSQNRRAGSALAWSLAEAIEGRETVDSLARLDQLPGSDSASLWLLRAARAFARNQADAGYEAMLTAWRLQPEAVAEVLKISNHVAALCARSKKNPPPALVKTVRELGAKATELAELDLLARCAASLTNRELALELWERVAIAPENQGRPFMRGYGYYLCYTATLELKEVQHRRTANLPSEGHAAALRSKETLSGSGRKADENVRQLLQQAAACLERGAAASHGGANG